MTTRDSGRGMVRHWREQRGRVTIDFTVVPMGEDVCLVVTGGNTPHLGAVAVAQARPSLKDRSAVSASTSVITLLGHKEDTLARNAAQMLAAKLNRNVVVCCGIHMDHITHDELKFIDKAVAQFCQDYVSRECDTPSSGFRDV